MPAYGRGSLAPVVLDGEADALKLKRGERGERASVGVGVDLQPRAAGAEVHLGGAHAGESAKRRLHLDRARGAAHAGDAQQQRLVRCCRTRPMRRLRQSGCCALRRAFTRGLRACTVHARLGDGEVRGLARSCVACSTAATERSAGAAVRPCVQQLRQEAEEEGERGACGGAADEPATLHAERDAPRRQLQQQREREQLRANRSEPGVEAAAAERKGVQDELQHTAA
mmetsp:Transcript_19009/g.36912  ORF Transcript_19009/g.36912 Transcript_19009/m.36912 type:complete len:227 (-) Transcript_19009:890-1570(-)